MLTYPAARPREKQYMVSLPPLRLRAAATRHRRSTISRNCFIEIAPPYAQIALLPRRIPVIISERHAVFEGEDLDFMAQSALIRRQARLRHDYPSP